MSGTVNRDLRGMSSGLPSQCDHSAASHGRPAGAPSTTTPRCASRLTASWSPSLQALSFGLMGLLRQLEPLLCELEQTFLITRLQRMFGQLDAIISIFSIDVSGRGHHRSPFALTERARLRAVARVSGEFEQANETITKIAFQPFINYSAFGHEIA